MDSDFVRMLQKTSGCRPYGTVDGNRPVARLDDLNANVPVPPMSPMRSSSGVFTFADESGPVGVMAGAAAPPPPPPQMQAIHMAAGGGAPYYVNPAGYQAVGVATAPAATAAPAHGHVGHQSVVLTSQGGQVMYMPLYLQSAPFQVGQPTPRVYPQAQGAYYQAHVVQVPPDGQVMQQSPAPAPYRVPQAAVPRGATPVTPPVPVAAQPGFQAASHAEAHEAPCCGVSVVRGALLPEGTPFIPYGVHPTSQYTGAEDRGGAHSTQRKQRADAVDTPEEYRSEGNLPLVVPDPFGITTAATIHGTAGNTLLDMEE